MKKTYLQPQFEIVNIKLGASILAGSLEKKDGTTVNDDLGGWVHQEQAWDIWGEEERKEQDELYYDEYEDEYYY